VNGRHTSLFSRRLELDSWYVENWSLGLDLKIAVETIPRLLCQADSLAYQDSGVDDRGFWRLIERPAADGGDAGVSCDPGEA
jgi:hypothetical protein